MPLRTAVRDPDHGLLPMVGRAHPESWMICFPMRPSHAASVSGSPCCWWQRRTAPRRTRTRRPMTIRSRIICAVTKTRAVWAGGSGVAEADRGEDRDREVWRIDSAERRRSSCRHRLEPLVGETWVSGGYPRSRDQATARLMACLNKLPPGSTRAWRRLSRPMGRGQTRAASPCLTTVQITTAATAMIRMAPTG